jgi:hypothetical protein
MKTARERAKDYFEIIMEHGYFGDAIDDLSDTIAQDDEAIRQEQREACMEAVKPYVGHLLSFGRIRDNILSSGKEE